MVGVTVSYECVKSVGSKRPDPFYTGCVGHQLCMYHIKGSKVKLEITYNRFTLSTWKYILAHPATLINQTMLHKYIYTTYDTHFRTRKMIFC